MKKTILLLFLISAVSIAQTNTIHIEVHHETCNGESVELYTGDFEEGGTFTFAGASLPLTLEAWQSYYDLFVGAGLTFPAGSLDNHIEVYVTLGSLDCSNPGLLADPTGQGFQIFMFFDITVYLNDEPIHMTFPAGTEPTLTFDNSKLLELLLSMGVFNMNDISFGYFDGGTFTTEGISINVGFLTTTLTLSHFSQFGGGIGNIYTDAENDVTIPVEYSLSQNYPNPFNPSTKISYSLPQKGEVKLTVYDMIGRKMATLINDEKNAGIHTVTFEAKNLSSGVYFYKLQTKDNLLIRKMLLIR